MVPQQVQYENKVINNINDLALQNQSSSAYDQH